MALRPGGLTRPGPAGYTGSIADSGVSNGGPTHGVTGPPFYANPMAERGGVMTDLSQWAADLRDTAADVIADTRRTRERSRRLVEAAKLLAARKAVGGGSPGEKVRVEVTDGGGTSRTDAAS